jgi:hypothetical protein
LASQCQASGFDMFTKWQGSLESKVGRKRLGAGLNVAAAFVESVIVLAQIDDSEIHEARSGLGRMQFGLAHQHGTDPCFLPRGIDGQQAQVGSFTLKFQVDASGERTFVIGDEELSFRQQRLNQFKIDTVAVDNEALSPAEGCVDQVHQSLGIRISSNT